MTVLEGIQKSSDFLGRKGVESARLNAELLLAQILKLPRMQLYLNFERPLTTTETNLLREHVLRRAEREPLQHILGSASFCGLEFAVNRHVLVPRPETELLAEAGWKFLGSMTSGPPTVLDLGTGSGCLAIVLAVKCPAAIVLATDISRDALAVAADNAARHDVRERIEFLESDGLKNLDSARRFDLILSNPPYIPSREIECLQPEVCDYDPRAALDGGEDGLDFFRRIASEGANRLNPQGRLLVEIGDGQAAAASAIFEAQNWIVDAIDEDYTQRPRVLKARR